MNAPYPVLYVPTRAARRAALKTLGQNGLWLNGASDVDTLSDPWESIYGSSCSYVWYSLRHDGVLMMDNIQFARDKASGALTLVNSVAHFISYVRSRARTS